jgi:meso-butanediol dehydrogenase / (S,S)-butanediol dehydrogenase / diacetyl reductase
MRLAGKVAIITGAGAGIGQATALLFAKEGAKVVVADANRERGEATVDLIEKAGGQAVVAQADVSKTADVRNMVETAMAAFGRIDVLVNNAGVFVEGTVVSTPETEWDRLLAINLTGTFLCMKYCIPEMIKGGGGSIVNIGSEAGLVGIANFLAYAATKSGVIALTKSTALDFVKDNIRVNCLCPGRTETPLVEKHIAESEDPVEARLRLSTDRPMLRMGRPHEISAGVLFLASDEASYATGSVLSIDGGYTAQ